MSLLAYRGKIGCQSGGCTRNLADDSQCYGWHCGDCDDPCSSQGHFDACNKVDDNSE